MATYDYPVLAWGHVGVRSNQDRSDGHRFTEGVGHIVLCDGIGSHIGSTDYAESIIAAYDACSDVELSKLLQTAAKSVERHQLAEGGTTVLTARVTARQPEDDIWCALEYVGNGGAIRAAGNFGEHLRFGIPYRYHQLILPDVDHQGGLLRYFSDRKESYSQRGKIEVLLQHPYGDIVLLYSDGVDSLENALVVADGQNRYWSLQSDVLIYILTKLDEWLLEWNDASNEISFEDNLEVWLNELLTDLHTEARVEDDVALGIIITPQVLSYYETRKTALNAEISK